jgi:hypothetical protein
MMITSLQAGSLRGEHGSQEITVVLAAVLVDQPDPGAGEALELRGLPGIDGVVHDAGDHRTVSLAGTVPAGGGAGRRGRR